MSTSRFQLGSGNDSPLFKRKPTDAKDIIPVREGPEITTVDGLVGALHARITELKVGPGQNGQLADELDSELRTLQQRGNIDVGEIQKLINRAESGRQWDSGDEKA